MPVLKNAKHEKFAVAIAKGVAIGKAYVLAGYTPNPSGATKMSKKVEIQARIQELLVKTAKKNEVALERYLQELAAIGFSDIRNLVNWRTLSTEVAGSEGDPGADRDPDTGEALPTFRHFNEVSLKGSHEITPAMAAAIASIKQNKDGTLEVKLHPKLPALQQIGQVLGALKPETPMVTPAGEVHLHQHDHNHQHIHIEDGQRARAAALLLARSQQAKDGEAA